MTGPIKLTQREAYILAALASGVTFTQMAARLVTSTQTIGRHRQRLYDKLGARTAGHAVYLGIACGLIKVGGVKP